MRELEFIATNVRKQCILHPVGLALNTVENRARNRRVVTRNATVRDLIFPTSYSAGKDDFPGPVERLETKTEPETGGGLDGLVECGVVHDFK